MFLARQGMPTAARSMGREHVEVFIAAEPERTAPSSAATRYRSLQQLFGWLDEDGEIDRSPMIKTRPPKIPDKPVPVPPDGHVRHLLADCPARTSATGGTWRSSAVPGHRDAARGHGRRPLQRRRR